MNTTQKMADDAPLKVAVMGVGRMGQHHARVYSQMPNCKLAAVVDANPENGQKISQLYGCPAFASIDALLAANLGLHAVTIAVPTIYHRAAAETLLAAGIDVLVEKPLAPTVQDANAIVAMAKKHARILQVGHTERFNPAMRALAKYDLRPRFVEVQRISPMTFRSIDVGVVLDMMIHDIDIVNTLVRSPVADVKAVGVTVIGQHEDIANARVVFANGCVANLTASRLALKTERKMRLFSPTAYVSVDFQKKTGVVITKTANAEQLAQVRQKVEEGQVADLTQLNYSELVKYEELKVIEVEPLKAEQESFLHTVRTRGVPEVTGEDGAAAVDIASRIASDIAQNPFPEGPKV